MIVNPDIKACASCEFPSHPPPIELSERVLSRPHDARLELLAMNPLRGYEGPQTTYPATRAANNFLSFLELLIHCGCAFATVAYANGPSPLTIIAARGSLVVAASLVHRSILDDYSHSGHC